MMNSALLITATFLLGVDYKVEESNGENTYVVEIEESIAEQLTEGFEVTSIVPAEHARIDKIRISIIEDSRSDEQSLVPDQESAQPPLLPDSSIVPPQPESSISTDFQLEPDVFAMPDLTPSAKPIDPSGSETVHAPEFVPTSENDFQPDDTTLGLLIPQEPIVSLANNQPEPPPSSIETVVENKQAGQAPATTAPVASSEDAQQVTPDEPKQITVADDTFLALATHQEDDQTTNATGDTLQATAESNTTSLLLLLFSVTLNLFLGVHVFRHNRT